MHSAESMRPLQVQANHEKYQKIWRTVIYADLEIRRFMGNVSSDHLAIPSPSSPATPQHRLLTNSTYNQQCSHRTAIALDWCYLILVALSISPTPL